MALSQRAPEMQGQKAESITFPKQNYTVLMKLYQPVAAKIASPPRKTQQNKNNRFIDDFRTRA